MGGTSWSLGFTFKMMPEKLYSGAVYRSVHALIFTEDGPLGEAAQ